ncbi:MAG TPA: acyl-CoA dehydrogenase family protein [Acidimicrobiales bacterium]|nr:acyl-CoA dehydrogenase family protein [Acidimicrobiales bacterium]
MADTAAQPSEEEFRTEALEFLEANARPRPPEKLVFGEGSDEVSVLPERTPDEDAREVAEAKDWAARVFDAGFGWITGPAEYGGRGLPGSYQRLYSALEAKYDTPSQAPRMIGLGMIAPTILAHGTEVAKRAYLRRLWRGDIIACQLFSEPSNGSDLAGVQTRAVRDGDEWVLNGQKVWTSGAQYSDIGEILCRSDPDLPKHKGLSAFLVDMNAPGVEVRPLRQMTGGASFNEVFFTDVRVPADHLLGDVNGGWTVALTTLMNERAAIGGGGAAAGGGATRRLLDLMVHLGATADPLLRQAYADLWIHLQVARWNNERALSKIRAGQLPGPELSIAKLSLTENMRRTAELAAQVLGPRITADSGEWGTYAWSRYLLGVPGMRVAGGTDEVMRNIVAERVLGLPKDAPPRA